MAADEIPDCKSPDRHQPVSPWFLPSIIGISLFCYYYCTTEELLQGPMVAAVFAVIEYIFTGLTEETKKERRNPLPLFETLERNLSLSRILAFGHTTWEQFFVNVFTVPLNALLWRHFRDWDFHYQVFVFPLHVYVIEILGGYYLTYIWGRRAWHYDAFFHGAWSWFDGNITLIYAPFWSLLGFIHMRMMRHVYVPLSFYLTYWYREELPSFTTSVLQNVQEGEPRTLFTLVLPITFFALFFISDVFKLEGKK